MFAQNCDPNVPVVDVDLTADAAGIFYSPNIIREGNCCGTTNPDRCIAFEITLHEDAQGIIFDICGGAIPPGALFYQVACGPEQPVGDVLCLDGAGPHSVTFCKPGNNQNVYCITSVPAPAAGPDTLASEGCTADPTSFGYDPATISRNSVAPGAFGEHNGLLTCQNCPDPSVNGPDPTFPFADFQVCGMPAGGCSSVLTCDTVRVFFASTLDVTVEPFSPAGHSGGAHEVALIYELDTKKAKRQKPRIVPCAKF